ncbi:MAG: hypothetical protein ACE5KZ_14955 [Candidatus Scalinduaceae bacterium]
MIKRSITFITVIEEAVVMRATRRNVITDNLNLIPLNIFINPFLFTILEEVEKEKMPKHIGFKVTVILQLRTDNGLNIPSENKVVG